MTWLPPDGLIREHHDYGIWHTDAPPIYHVGSILTALAAMVADNAQVVSMQTAHPLNLWTMLVGDSTRDRKTTSARLAISRAEFGNRDRIIRIYGSPEGFLDSLVLHPCAAIYVPEGGAFFAQRKAGYWKHAQDMLMDLYDPADVFERRLVNKVVRIDKPRVSMLAATARSLLERYTNDLDWTGGFLARFLMLSGETLPFKEVQSTNPVAERRIASLLDEAKKRQWGNLAVTSPAQDILRNFAREINTGLDAFPKGIHPALLRLVAMSYRLAGLYEIARQVVRPPLSPKGSGLSRAYMVTKESARHAVALCRASRDLALMASAELTVPQGRDRQTAKVELIIRQSGPGGISRKELTRRTRMYRRETEDVLTMLEEAGLIELAVRSSGPKGGRPATFYTHVHAADDLKRQTEDQPGTMWIDLSGKTPLPRDHPDWRTDLPDDDDDVAYRDPSWIPPDDDGREFN